MCDVRLMMSCAGVLKSVAMWTEQLSYWVCFDLAVEIVRFVAHCETHCLKPIKSKFGMRRV